MKFGEKLQTLRRAKGLSQEQLAEALGATRQPVSKWELNASLPDVEKLLVLSDFFQVSTDYLLKESMVTPPAPAQEFVPPPRRRLNVKLLVGAILTGASSLALFVVWVLSRVYPATYIVQDPMQNYTQVWTGYAGFVRLHDLSPLTISCWVLLVIGLVLLFWKPLDRRFALAQHLRRLARHPQKPSPEEPPSE